MVKGHDRTAEEDRLIAAGKMAPPPSTLLSVDAYRTRSERWYGVGADGVHLFNETRVEAIAAVAEAARSAKP